MSIPSPRRRPVKDIKFNFRIDRKLKEDAERAAAADNRSLASLIVKLLQDYLAKTKPGAPRLRVK
jgi:predicted HicB family RNase H-like nuclease